MNIELDFFQTPPTLGHESSGENNSEPQHLTLHHPDFLLREGGIPEGLNCAKHNGTFFSVHCGVGSLFPPGL